MEINSNALYILGELNKANYEAYIVGGCVRDSLLGKKPNDWDICTNATPEQSQEVFKGNKIVPIGLEHGTIAVVLEREHFEITTYRIDGDYTDGRRPEEVRFTESIVEDLSRRDFTVNAMAYSPEGGLIDPFKGEKCLGEKVITCVGNADRRFKEDGLRIMRAIRFSSQLGFILSEETKKSIKKNSKLINYISKERINSELTKILVSDNPGKGIGLMNDLGVFESLGYSNMSEEGYSQTPKLVEVRLAILLHRYGTRSEEIMRELRFGNTEISNVTEIIKYKDTEIKGIKSEILKMLNRAGEKQLRNIIELQRALGLIKQGNYKGILSELAGMNLDEECYELRHLQVTGNDIIEMGVKPGKEIGEILKGLLDKVMEGKIDNNIEELENEISKYMSKRQ